MPSSTYFTRPRVTYKWQGVSGQALDVTEQLPGMARRLAGGRLLGGFPHQPAQVLAIRLGPALQELRQGRVALGDEPVAPAFGLLETGLGQLVGALELFQGGPYRRRVHS